MSRPRWFPILLALALFTPGCGDDPTAPVPNVLEAVLVGPPTPVGALLFLVQGGTVDSVVANGDFLASRSYSAVAREVVVAGAHLHGVIARVYVPDITGPYNVGLQQVAHDSSFQLLAPAGYRVELRRVYR